MENASRILTIGHSNHPIERFLQLLQNAGVTLLADVRSFPTSRYAPQFNRETLAQALKTAGIAYAYFGKELGGRGAADPAALQRDRKSVV